MADDGNQTRQTWRSDELLDAMWKRAEPYANAPGELEQLLEEGRIALIPRGRFLLMRAILPSDATVMGRGTMDYNARGAIAHEVIAISKRAQKYLDKHGDDTKTGDHVFILSTNADRASKTSAATRLWLLDVRDLHATIVHKR